MDEDDQNDEIPTAPNWAMAFLVLCGFAASFGMTLLICGGGIGVFRWAIGL